MVAEAEESIITILDFENESSSGFNISFVDNYDKDYNANNLQKTFSGYSGNKYQVYQTHKGYPTNDEYYSTKVASLSSKNEVYFGAYFSSIAGTCRFVTTESFYNISKIEYLTASSETAFKYALSIIDENGNISQIYNNTANNLSTDSSISNGKFEYIGYSLENKLSGFIQLDVISSASTGKKFALDAFRITSEEKGPSEDEKEELFVINYYMFDNTNNSYELDSAEGYAVGETVVKPNDPVIDNYTFICWIDEDDNEYMFDFIVTDEDKGKEINLYANFKENEKYQVDYYDGNELLLSDNLYENSSIEYTPLKSGYTFDGWYTDIELTTPLEDSYVVTSEISLYAKWNKLSNELNQSDINSTFEKTSNIIENYNDTIFSFTVGMTIVESDDFTLSNGETSTYRIRTHGSSYNDDNTRTIKFIAPEDGILDVEFSADGKSIGLFVGESKDGLKISYTDSDKTNAQLVKFNVSKGITYEIGAVDGEINIFSLKFYPTINYQYDNDSAPTALRIMSIIDCEDLTTINSITYSFVKNGVPANKSIEITKVYTSVVGAFDIVITNRYYAVYSLIELPLSSLGQSFEITLTIEYNDSTSSISTRSFILGQ